MPNAISSAQGGLTRRGFLKATGAVGAIGLAAGAMATADEWLVPAQAHAEGVQEYTACTYHQGHCGGMCPLKCTVRDGRMVMVEPNHSFDERYDTICLKGISEVQHIYGEGRIQTPLKRAGERGANEFVQVTWDEALDDIVAQLKQIKGESGGTSIVVMGSTEANVPFMAAMLGAQTGGNTGIDVGTGNGLDPAIGFGGGYATSTGEPRDWVNSKMVLSVGTNFCESTLPQVRLFFEAKEAGARMVTVDPHFSTTASKSDEWVPIEPGTDAALFLGMISCILDEGLADVDFMRDHTSLPFLVDKATGKLVRDHAEDPNAEEPETGEQNPFFVVDASGAVVPYTQAASPVLDAAATARGVEAVTVYQLMVEGQKAYTPAWASEITGIPAEKICELAREYAAGPSSLALGWGGNDKMTNADIAGHAAALLAAVTGNISKPGANIGVFVGGIWSAYAATLGSWTLPEDWATADNDMPIYDMRTGESACRALICNGDTIAQKLGNMGVTEKWLEKLDLVVTIDTYFTEGAKWSDYVLPVTSRFEMDAEVGNVKNGYNQIVVQQKVIDPLFEAKTDLWVEKEIGRRWGIAEDALPADSLEYARAILANSEDPYVSDLTIEQIVGNGCVWPMENIEKPRITFADLEFATTSTRMDVYYDNLVSYNQALPQWEECEEIGASSKLRDKYPLQLGNVRSRFRIHNQFNDAKWCQQYYEPTIEINPVEMASRGLEQGDAVEVFNDRGSFSVRVAGNESIRPGSARMIEAATADYTLRGNMQSVTNDTMIERGYELLCGPVTPFSDTLVEIKKA